MMDSKRTYLFFRISVLLKGVSAFLEIIGGVIALFVPVSFVVDFLTDIAEGELVDDPNNILATNFLHIAQGLSLPSGGFIAFYLLSRGIIKLGLVIALLKNQLWAYPSSLGVLSLLILYQAYQITLDHSIPLILLTLFDFVVMYFIWKEYEIVKRRTHKPLAS